jgi:PKD repeat protein
VGPVTIGNYCTSASTSPSYNNSATVQGGAVWNCGNSTFYVGWAAGTGAATGNVLTVGVGGIVTNASHLYITASNTLNMAGGVVVTTADCYGTLQGFGTVGNNATIENGAVLSPFNSFGALVFSKKLALSSASTTTVQLGTNYNATVVQGALTLNGTLNVTDGGGFGDGTYTLFTYDSTLIYSNLTIGAVPSGGYTCTLDTTSTTGAVNLIVTGGTKLPPQAAFTGTPTSGAVPLMVTFTDSSTGTITNRFWNFGDGTTTNTLTNSLAHTYNNVGSYDVSLTVSGPSGTTTLRQASYIIAGNAPLVITSAATVTNAALQVGNVIVVVADDTNVFSVGATNTEGGTLSYQWSFGDGVTNAWSPSNTVDHAYGTNCGPYDASVTISNGYASVTSNFTVVVACSLDLGKLAPKVNFAKTNSDSCAITGTFGLPTNTIFAGMSVTLDIGGGSLTFTLPNKKGTAVNGFSTFSTPTFNKKADAWNLKASFTKGFWQADWANYGMTNATISKPGVPVSDLPVILLLDNEAFMATTNLHYTATQGKSGAAK